MHYRKVLERVDFPEQTFHRSFSLGAPVMPVIRDPLFFLFVNRARDPPVRPSMKIIRARRHI